MMKNWFFQSLALFFWITSTWGEVLPKEEITLILSEYTSLEQKISEHIKLKPNAVELFSRRGDARMFLGDFRGARKDYEKMIQLEPLLKVSHWRLGITYFYLGLFKKAAHQFEIYHQHDAVDRENGIWRFMSQVQQSGVVEARQNLIKYKQSDRPPYPWLYDLFKGEMKPPVLFARIHQAKYPKGYHSRVLFHAYLYVGIYLEMVEGKITEAEKYLAQAVSNEYGRTTGTYMWQVARIHYQQIQKRARIHLTP
jgi:lipoprotein NlpI